jgi:hypothetical protein
VLCELRREHRDGLVENEGVTVERVAFVRGPRQEAQSLRPEQPPLWRARESESEVERRHSGRAAVLQCLAEKPNVVSRVALEPFREPTVQLASRVLRQVGQCGFADQVVRQPDRACRSDCKAAFHELGERALAPRRLPAGERRHVDRGNGSPCNGQERQHAGGVGARAAQTHGQQGRERLAGAAADERLEPEG